MSTTALLSRPVLETPILTPIQPSGQFSDKPAPIAPAPARKLNPGVEARGFALYIGVSEEQAAANGTSLQQISQALQRTLRELVPNAQTHSVVALAPEGAGGSDIEIVRLALQDPEAISNRRGKQDDSAKKSGVTIDTTRKQVLLDGLPALLTYREFEILQFLVLREGTTVARENLVDNLWLDSDDDKPNDRTIDVHIRRLRAKLGDYGAIIRTVRGLGYRFDRHADVTIVSGHGPSSDLF